jgi:serine protease AprX
VQFKSSGVGPDLAADGATSKSELPLVHAQLVTVKAGNLSSIASYPDVAYISPDRPVRGAVDSVVTAVNADLANASGWNGAGVGIAVIDSGVNNVTDLNSDGNTAPSRVVYGQSFVSGNGRGNDDYGHGTHVAGIIAGNAYTSTNLQYYPDFYQGIAPEANIINLRVLDGTGAGTDSGVVSAIQQAISLKNSYNIRVINLSLSRGVYESYALDPLCQAVESAWKAGIVVVAAAGNMGQYNGAGTNGYATIGAPGNDPYVITVGATHTHSSGAQTAQAMTSYSSKGPSAIDHIVKPDLVAPGNAVVSLRSSQSNKLASLYPTLVVYPCHSSRTNCGSSHGKAQYFQLSGSSMSTPVVSGAAALLLQQTPSLTPDQVKARLMKTAWKNFPQYMSATDLGTGTVYQMEADIFTVGAGSVDAAAALASTDLAPATVGSALSPTAMYNSSNNTVTIAGAPGTVWNNSVVWGNSVVCGVTRSSGVTP